MTEFTVEVELFKDYKIKNEKFLNSDTFKEQLNLCNDIYQLEAKRIEHYKPYVMIKGTYQPEYDHLTIYSYAKKIDAIQIITYSFNPDFYEEYERRVIYGGKTTLEIFQLFFDTKEEH